MCIKSVAIDALGGCEKMLLTRLLLLKSKKAQRKFFFYELTQPTSGRGTYMI